MNEKTEQIKALMSDEAFVEACFAAESEEAVHKLFADKGVEMSLDEIELLKKLASAAAEGKNLDELSEEELAEVAGGDFLSRALDLFTPVKNLIKRTADFILSW